MSENLEYICSICICSYSKSDLSMKLNRCEHMFHKNYIEDQNKSYVDQNLDYNCPHYRQVGQKINKLTGFSIYYKEFQVFLQNDLNQTKIINVDSEMTVNEFTNLVHILTQIRPEKCHFTCNGKVFSITCYPDKLLKDLNINKILLFFNFLDFNKGNWMNEARNKQQQQIGSRYIQLFGIALQGQINSNTLASFPILVFIIITTCISSTYL